LFFKIYLFLYLESERCLIFVETSQSADYIGAALTQKQLMCATIHRNRTQQQRTEALQQFTNGECPILVATSVADGLDFPLIGYVVNYDLPYSIDFYIHLIGRTGWINKKKSSEIVFQTFISYRSCWSFR
jgi:superfamily II DNA/RNA helicase